MAVRKVKKKRFRWSKGAGWSDKKAQEAGEELDRLASVRGGRLKPPEIVEEAQNPASPLHPYFTWDVKKAARQYWIKQAQNLVNHLIVVIEMVGGETVGTKAFHSIVLANPESDARERAYVDVPSVKASPDFRTQIIKKAIQELDYWKKTYAEYEELFGFFKAIDKEKKKLGGGLEEK